MLSANCNSCLIDVKDSRVIWNTFNEQLNIWHDVRLNCQSSWSVYRVSSVHKWLLTCAICGKSEAFCLTVEHVCCIKLDCINWERHRSTNRRNEDGKLITIICPREYICNSVCCVIWGIYRRHQNTAYLHSDGRRYSCHCACNSKDPKVLYLKGRN